MGVFKGFHKHLLQCMRGGHVWSPVGVLIATGTYGCSDVLHHEKCFGLPRLMLHQADAALLGGIRKPLQLTETEGPRCSMSWLEVPC